MTVKAKASKLRRALIPLVGVLVSTGALAVNSYDPGTKLLTLDAVQVSGTTYRSVTVTVNSFDQLVVAGGTPGQDSFDPAANILRMGSVNFESNTYTNVSVRINGFSLQGVGSDANGYLQNTVPTTLSSSRWIVAVRESNRFSNFLISPSNLARRVIIHFSTEGVLTMH